MDIKFFKISGFTKYAIFGASLSLNVFSSVVYASPFAVYEAVVALDAMQTEKKMAMLSQQRDAAFFTSLLEIQEGILELQEGQIILLESIKSLDKSFKKSLTQNELQNSYDILIGTTETLVAELKAMKRDIETNDSKDIKSIITRAKKKYLNYEQERAVFIAKSNDVELAVEMQLVSLWETEKVFMEALNIAKSTRIEIAHYYLTKIQSHLSIPRRSLRSKVKARKTVFEKENEYFIKIQKVGWLGIHLSKYYPITAPKQIEIKNKGYFVCGERATISNGTNAFDGHLYKYMSKELINKYKSSFPNEFDVEGPKSIKKHTRKNKVTLKGFKVDIKTPSYSFTPYYNGYGVITGSGSFKPVFTNCNVDVSNDKEVRACEKHAGSGERKGWVDSKKLTLLCDIPSKNYYDYKLYDGKSLLDTFVSNDRIVLENNLKASNQLYSDTITHYNEAVVNYQFYNITINSLRLAEERILRYLKALNPKGVEVDNSELIDVEISLSRTANVFNQFRLSKATQFDKSLESYKSDLFDRARKRQKGIEKFQKNIDKYNKIAQSKVGLGDLREMVSMMGYVIKGVQLMDEYALFAVTENDTFQSSEDLANRAPASSDPKQLVDDNLKMSKVEKYLGQLEEKYQGKSKISAVEVEKDFENLSNAFSNLLDLDKKYSNKKDVVDKWLDKGINRGVKMVLQKVIGKVATSGFLEAIKDGKLTDGSKLGTQNILYQEERATKLSIDVLNKKMAPENIYINRNLY